MPARRAPPRELGSRRVPDARGAGRGADKTLSKARRRGSGGPGPKGCVWVLAPRRVWRTRIASPACAHSPLSPGVDAPRRRRLTCVRRPPPRCGGRCVPARATSPAASAPRHPPPPEVQHAVPRAHRRAVGSGGLPGRVRGGRRPGPARVRAGRAARCLGARGPRPRVARAAQRRLRAARPPRDREPRSRRSPQGRCLDGPRHRPRRARRHRAGATPHGSTAPRCWASWRSTARCAGCAARSRSPRPRGAPRPARWCAPAPPRPRRRWSRGSRCTRWPGSGTRSRGCAARRSRARSPPRRTGPRRRGRRPRRRARPGAGAPRARDRRRGRTSHAAGGPAGRGQVHARAPRARHPAAARAGRGAGGDAAALRLRTARARMRADAQSAVPRAASLGLARRVGRRRQPAAPGRDSRSRTTACCSSTNWPSTRVTCSTRCASRSRPAAYGSRAPPAPRASRRGRS